jgi:hypothetical protein
MDVHPWAALVVMLGVLVYISVPVALALIYVSRVHAVLRRDKSHKRVLEGGDPRDGSERAAASEPRERSGATRAPASERVRGSGGR